LLETFGEIRVVCIAFNLSGKDREFWLLSGKFHGAAILLKVVDFKNDIGFGCELLQPWHQQFRSGWTTFIVPLPIEPRQQNKFELHLRKPVLLCQKNSSL